MSCNCGNIQTCQQCSAGLPCNCPPDFSVVPQPVSCGCCPPGYTFQGITPNFPNGMCLCNDLANGGSVHSTTCATPQVPAIPCSSCTDAVSSDCVFVSNVPCLGVGPIPTALTGVLGYLCSEAFILNLLQTVGLSTTLKAALCEIVSICPSTGSTTPIPGPIIVTVP